MVLSKNIFDCKGLVFLIALIVCINYSKYINANICDNQDPDWIFCDDFETGTLPDNGWYYNSLGGTYFPSYPNASTFINSTESYSGAKCLEQYIPAGNTGSQGRASIQFTAQDTIYVRYYRKFETGWVFNSDRPMHSTLLFAGTYVSPTTTDLTIYEDNHDVTNKTQITVRSAYQDNMILPEATNYVKESYLAMPFNVTEPVVFVPGQWYEIQYMVKMNTPELQDGELKLWVDGTLVKHHKNLVLRDDLHSSIQFDRFMFGPNYPPSGPPQNQSNYIDALVISTAYIDPASSDTTPPAAPTNLQIQ